MNSKIVCAVALTLEILLSGKAMFAATEQQLCDLERLTKSGNFTEANALAKELIQANATARKVAVAKLRSLIGDRIIDPDTNEQIAATSKDIATIDNQDSSIVALLAKIKVSDQKGSLEIAEQIAPNKVKDISFFDKLHNAGFTLQRALTATRDEAEPADFSFLHNFESGGETIYSTDFFFSWSPNQVISDACTGRKLLPVIELGQNADLKLESSVEAKLTSDTTAQADNAWRFRLTGGLDTNSESFISHTHTMFSFKDETDQDFNLQRLSAEIWFTFNLRKQALALGGFTPESQGDKLPPVQFRWRPYFGADLGGVVDSSNTPTQDDSQQRVIFRITGQMKLNFVKTALNFNDVSLFADDYVYYLFQDAKDQTHNFLTAGLNFMFNENFGFTLTYKVGQDAPEFESTRTLGGALSVKF